MFIITGPDTRRLYSPSRQVAPKFYTYPHNKVVEEGAHVIFQCSVTGHPTPWATWDKDGVIITPSARITIREKEDIRFIEIEEVTIEDAGLYRITLENDFGRVEASARLDVISHRGKYYGGIRAYSASPRRSVSYRRHLASSSSRQTDTMTRNSAYRNASPSAYRQYKDTQTEELFDNEEIVDDILESDAPVIEFTKKHVSVEESKILLRVDYNGYRQPNIIWFKDVSLYIKVHSDPTPFSPVCTANFWVPNLTSVLLNANFILICDL